MRAIRSGMLTLGLAAVLLFGIIEMRHDAPVQVGQAVGPSDDGTGPPPPPPPKGPKQPH